jgi:hypothetical protein
MSEDAKIYLAVEVARGGLLSQEAPLRIFLDDLIREFNYGSPAHRRVKVLP